MMLAIATYIRPSYENSLLRKQTQKTERCALDADFLDERRNVATRATFRSKR